MKSILSKLVGRSNNRELRKFQHLVDKINDLERIFKGFADFRLQAKTEEFRQRLVRGENSENILPEAFATVREAANRILKMRHFDCQILGGIVLHQGKIAQIKTGEGKTLVATLPVYLNALCRKGVHVVTENEYLSKKNKEWMGPLYEYLGLSVGLISPDMDSQLKEEAYSCDITYAPYLRFGLDYLSAKLYGTGRNLSYAILDEVDTILIDNAMQELVITTENKSPLMKITPLHYFQKYNKLAGMAGNVSDDMEIFDKVYKLEVISIPARKPMNRVNHQDLIYKSKNAKFMAIVDEVDYWHGKGRPILVSAASVQDAEIISDILEKKEFNHMILNQTDQQEESKIIALAGQRRAITIAVNICATRQVIPLGEGVAKIGGLHIIGTERHYYRRLDNQLCDLTGINGNPGSTRFFLSLEDDLLKLFGSHRISTIMDKLGMEEDQPVEHILIVNAIKNAQLKLGKNMLKSLAKFKESKDNIKDEKPKEIPKSKSVPVRVSLTLSQRIAVWRFSKAWGNFCVPMSMAKDSALVKGLIALEKNNRQKARRIWESLQRHFPKDYRVTHTLALLNYWETVSAKNPKSFNDEIIGKTISNWVMLLNSDFFWEVWRGKRQPFYFHGNISNSQIEELRHALKVHLENTISRDHRNVLLLESKTAELLSSIAEWGKRKGLDSQLLIAGPLMLKELGMLERARQLALLGIQVEPENNDFKSLCQYLSPLGIATLLLRAERIENTFEELGKIENRDRWVTKEFKKEFSEAIIKWVNQSQNDKEAIDRLERATKIILDNELSYLLSTYYEKVAIEAANKDPPNWNRAIECLKKALKLFRSIDIEKNIAKCLHQRSMEKTNNLLKAMETLRNKQPRVRVGSIIDNKLGGILLPDIIARFQSQPSCDYCGNLISVQYLEREINNKSYKMCMSCWSKEKNEIEKILFSLRGECLDDLREANTLDLDNQKIRKSLQDIERIVSQIQESLK